MSHTLRQNIASLRPIRGLLLSVAVARCSVMLLPFYGAYLAVTRQGLPSAAIGLVIGAFGVGALLADVAVSSLTKHRSERSVAVLGMVGVSTVVAVISVTPGLLALTALTAFWGFCYELINPISYTLAAKSMPESSRRFAFAAVRLAVNVGMGIGPVLAGVLYKVTPVLLVWGTAIGYLLAAAILAKTTLTGDQPVDESSSDVADVLASTRSQDEFRFWAFFAAIVPVHLAYALPPTVLSVYVIQHLGKPPIWVSTIFAVNAALVITCEISINHLMIHWRRRTTLLVGYLCGLIGFGLMGFGEHLAMLLAATAVWTLGEMIVFPAILDHVSAISPERLKARNIGFYAAGVNLGVLVAPLCFIPLITILNGRESWAVVAGLLAVGMMGVGYLSAEKHKHLWTNDGPPMVTVKGN